MANPIPIIRKGESLDFTFDLGGSSIAGWTCTINVKQYPSDTSAITRVISPDNSTESWTGYLTETETDGLTTNTLYWLIGILEESTTDEKREVPKRFRVTQTWTA